MKNIEEFLSKFKLIEDPAKDKQKVIGILNELLGINIGDSSVAIKNKNIVISLEPVLKSYLFTKKEGLIMEIEQKLQKEGVSILFK